ncbi:hypothetical protein FOFC_08858 [Fusarium oxysporum]|nr:hypothetical protein FOFC_08858 [Fusarium oxysporum]
MSCLDLDLIPSLVIAPYSYRLKALSLVVHPLESSHRSLICIDLFVSSVMFSVIYVLYSTIIL